ncbi:uncharacterized protein BX663DRAFT_123162 [Cokeromyces recurvatus]|uniref:uncharacterized protein n=1 Tax=Cokeromyces recurvatus TaxID=90255 RepID=UPI0022212A6E|nr:uncharacterized protein BX663DRAFT_123162 [Cokeromyces recurvatus]KAI7906963.1 hypothetical protein BX663DRAFT_123162 [Cokeromyces recurvatus]
MIQIIYFLIYNIFRLITCKVFYLNGDCLNAIQQQEFDINQGINPNLNNHVSFVIYL